MALPREYPYAVSFGEILGHVSASRIGINDNVPSANFILLSNVTSGASPINFPAVAQQMQVVSSSASDTAAGTGAQQVEITYLTSPTNVLEPFKKKIEIVTLTGLVPVTTNATDIFRIDKFRVSRVGTGLFSAGNISLQDTLGAITFERIDAGTNAARTCIHFVPKGFGCLLTEFTIGCSTSGGTIFILEQTFLDPSNNDVTSGVHQVEIANQGLHVRMASPHNIQNVPGKIMFFALVVKGRTANQTAAGTINFIDYPL